MVSSCGRCCVEVRSTGGSEAADGERVQNGCPEVFLAHNDLDTAFCRSPKPQRSLLPTRPNASRDIIRPISTAWVGHHTVPVCAIGMPIARRMRAFHPVTYPTIQIAFPNRSDWKAMISPSPGQFRLECTLIRLDLYLLLHDLTSSAVHRTNET